MAKRTKYGEETIMVSFRVPISRLEDFKSKSYALLDYYSNLSKVSVVVPDMKLSLGSLDKLQYGESEPLATSSVTYKEVASGKTVKIKVIKEPIKLERKPIGIMKSYTVAGYGGCLKNEYSDNYYWEGNSWLEFDNLQHITDYLTKNKT